jgi:ribose transport system permease protein
MVTETKPERTAAPPARKRSSALDLMRRYGLLGVWALVVVFFSAARPETFLTFANLQNIAGAQAVLVVLTLGLIIPSTAGEFDLSVASVAGLAAVAVAWLAGVHGWPLLAALPIAIIIGAVVGLINGFFVVKLEVPSIIVTLGTGTLLGGVAVALNNPTTSVGSRAFIDATHNAVFGLPLAFYYAILLTAVIWYVYTYTPVGRYLYFVGAGRDVARLAGLNVDRIRWGSFVASGVISALAGILLAGWLGSADPTIGPPFLLPAFAAAFLGSTVVTPGRFNPVGSLIAAYFLVTGITGLQLMGLSGWIEQVFYGASLVLAVSFSNLLTRRSGQTA